MYVCHFVRQFVFPLRVADAIVQASCDINITRKSTRNYFKTQDYFARVHKILF